MKYVQIGILACLIVVAGLLFGIYRGQQSNNSEPAIAQATTSIELADVAPPEAAPAVVEPVVEPAVAKPSPLPVKRPKTQRTPSPEPQPAEPEIAEATPADLEPPESEPLESAAPEPITEPVIPNLPPLVGMPQPEPLPRRQLVTVPAGSQIVVRLINTLSTNRNLPGDSFQATLDEPLEVDGWLVAAKGSRVHGRVIESKPAGRVKGVAQLSFELVQLTTVGGETVDIKTAAFAHSGEKSQSEDLRKVGWGAGLGAIIGAIAGGGKGAAIGAGAGAGAGVGTVLATRGKTLVVPTETRLMFRLSAPVVATSTRPVAL